MGGGGAEWEWVGCGAGGVTSRRDEVRPRVYGVEPSDPQRKCWMQGLVGKVCGWEGRGWAVVDGRAWVFGCSCWRS